jgi:hypothetical protein
MSVGLIKGHSGLTALPTYWKVDKVGEAADKGSGRFGPWLARVQGGPTI